MELMRLKGVTEKRAKDLEKLGIADSAQLVRYFPRTYLDMTDRTSVRNVYHNDMALVAAQLVSVDPTNFYSRHKTVRARLVQDGIPFTAVWFNMPYLAKSLKPGNISFTGACRIATARSASSIRPLNRSPATFGSRGLFPSIR